MAAGSSVARMGDEENSFRICYRMEASCVELALEGERLCKVGDYTTGVSFFQAAMKEGTDDLQVLSAIYSQLGNAYFHLQDYSRALTFHHHDRTLTRTMGDLLGEAKACGNLGNTLKVLGRYDEALVFCQRHLDICRDAEDKVGQARALFHFGNVYHAKGKSLCRSDCEPGHLPEEISAALRTAAQYYQENLSIVKDLGDRAAQGRTCGNLGNTYYLLGDFHSAVVSHQQRLLIAKEFGDRAAERRAYCNLGNAYIFLGQFEKAAEHYKKALQLARQLKDRAVEAQACYSLGSTYTLLQDYERAVDYHLKHLLIAQDLNDRVGEGRAYWSLGNAHTALGNHEQAVHFAERHLEITKETGDRSGELTARMNVSDLQLVLGLSYTSSSILSESRDMSSTLHGARSRMERRNSMENLELMKLTPDKLSGQLCGGGGGGVNRLPRAVLVKSRPGLGSRLLSLTRLRGKKQPSSSSKVLQDSSNTRDPQPSHKRASEDMLGDEGFFDLLSRFQGNRMDDQRCSIQQGRGCQFSTVSNSASSSNPPDHMKTSLAECVASPGQEAFAGQLDRAQDRRLDAQRAAGGLSSSWSRLAGPGRARQAVLGQLERTDTSEPDEQFLDMLVKCQGSRLNDQRCAPPTAPARGLTIPDEDFFSLILRSQAKRMDEQRVTLPSTR
ncbi:G-protein-signaling modulator 2-like [Brachyhypopomus gauderio]|uniref:G-protein-signaling modulator 2-like n=1 Tax=Brachyhypopomus gauderio TaxID=698409 RepID=UPI0040410692